MQGSKWASRTRPQSHLSTFAYVLMYQCFDFLSIYFQIFSLSNYSSSCTLASPLFVYPPRNN